MTSKNNTPKNLSLFLLSLLLLSSMATPIAAEPTAAQENDTVTPDDVVEAMENETAYRTDFSVEMHAGDQYQGMDGWIAENASVNRARGEMILTGEKSVTAQFYVTEDRFYFNRTNDRRWYWDDAEDGMLSDSMAPEADLLLNGTVLRTEGDWQSGTTTFVVRPTPEQYQRWTEDSDSSMDVSQSRFYITVDNETARIRRAEMDMSGTVEGEAFTISASFEYSEYGEVGNITIPEEVQNAEKHTLFDSLIGGLLPGSPTQMILEKIRSLSEMERLAAMGIMLSYIILVPLLFIWGTSAKDEDQEFDTPTLEENDS